MKASFGEYNMRKYYLHKIIFNLFAVVFTIILCSDLNAAEGDWPLEIVAAEAKIVIYQPQLESFKEDRLTARSAVSATKTGTTEPVFGALWFEARVSTDRDSRLVTILDVNVTKVKFPHTPNPAKVEKFSNLVKKEIHKKDMTISLDRLLTMLDLVEKEKAVAEDFKISPPKIIFVTHPAVLVSIDGDPELRKIENSTLMRVVNSPFFIVFNSATKTYYLKGGDKWFAARDVMGPWQNEPDPPPSVVAVASSELSGQDEGTTQKGDERMPQMIVVTKPAELITTDGEPKYTPVSGTDLLYMSNTESDVFMEIVGQKYYTLLSGRWFTSASLKGPWSHVPADKLPADFSKIPQGSAKGHVLANIAGTEQAKEAVLDTYIPQTAAIKREGVKIVVEYDGAPKFKKIESADIYYAINTPYSVIRVGNMYYLCHEAAWYAASSPLGPWAVSVSVPQVIYTIPPSYPVYNVTYVHVYDYTPTVVYVGYYPGYLGSYVYGGTVVYGTGYVYRGWYGRVYYARPVTWGYSVHYSSYTGVWGVRVGYPAPGVWYGGRAVWGIGHVARRAYWRNEYRDHRDWRSDRYDDRRDFQKDRYDDRRDRRDDQLDRRDERADRERPGDRQEKVSERRKDRPQADRDKAGSRVDSGKSQRTSTERKRQNNVYSDRNGNVHRKTEKGWQQRSSSGWSKPDAGSRQSSSRSRTSKSNLNRQSQARERGASRSNNYQRSRSSSGSRGSGASRGGGSRRRR